MTEKTKQDQNKLKYTAADMVTLTRGTDEQEIVITAGRTDQVAEVYISDNLMVSKFRKLVEKAPDKYIITQIPKDQDGNPTGYFIEMPKKLVGFRMPRVEMTDEQKAVASERIKNMRKKS